MTPVVGAPRAHRLFDDLDRSTFGGSSRSSSSESRDLNGPLLIRRTSATKEPLNDLFDRVFDIRRGPFGVRRP
jgi:hypothetical protein